MAYYAYKHVRDLLPDWVVKEQGEGYDGDGNYDGDQWYAAETYIKYLIETVKSFDKDFDFTKRITKE